MKVLSVQQPWASLIVDGHKKIETRSFNTKHRGILLIHSSKRLEDWRKELCHTEPFIDFVRKDLTLGSIIGSVELCWTVDTKYCLEGNEFEHLGIKIPITKKELAFGDFTPGRKGWMLANPIAFQNPIPCKGKLGIWECPFELLPLIQHQFV